jgi:hypothetical protein
MSESQSKPKQRPSYYWPIITDSKSAAEVCKGAATVCFLVAGLNLIVATVAIYVGHPVFGMSGFSLADVAAFGILGYFIGWRKSRVAAVLAVASFLVGKIYVFVPLVGNYFSSLDSAHQFPFGGIVVAFIVGTPIFHGIRGTFAYAKFQKLSASPAPSDCTTDGLLREMR